MAITYRTGVGDTSSRGMRLPCPTVAQRPLLRCGLAFPSAIVLTTILGCAPQHAIENAHERGAQAGYEEGRRAGEAAGFSAARRAARKEVYRATLDELYSSGKFRRMPFCTLGVLGGFFIFGFGLQWMAFYVCRAVGHLPDIDWVVLPKQITDVHLTELSAPKMEPERLEPPSAAITLILSLALLLIVGCRSPEQEAWQQGYDANYRAGYDGGWRDGAVGGREEGAEDGRAAAQNAAETGRAWQLYSTLAVWALVLGVVAGVSTQYIVLLRCRLSGCLAELLSVALVPAVRSSLSFSIFERRRECMIWWDEEVRKLAAARTLKFTQVQAVHDVMVRKVKALSSLEDYSHARLLDLAREEFSKIISASEREAGERSAERQGTPTRYTYNCPHCGRRIAYKERKAGKRVICPYKECGSPVNLPPLTSYGHSVPPVSGGR